MFLINVTVHMGSITTPYLWDPARADTNPYDHDIVRILGDTSLRHFLGDGELALIYLRGRHWALML